MYGPELVVESLYLPKILLRRSDESDELMTYSVRNVIDYKFENANKQSDKNSPRTKQNMYYSEIPRFKKIKISKY